MNGRLIYWTLNNIGKVFSFYVRLVFRFDWRIFKRENPKTAVTSWKRQNGHLTDHSLDAGKVQIGLNNKFIKVVLYNVGHIMQEDDPKNTAKNFH